jgi:hypothetical protein
VLAQKNKLGFKEDEGAYAIQWIDRDVDTVWRWIADRTIDGLGAKVQYFKTLSKAEEYISKEQEEEFQNQWEIIPLSNGKAEM